MTGSAIFFACVFGLVGLVLYIAMHDTGLEDEWTHFPDDDDDDEDDWK